MKVALFILSQKVYNSAQSTGKAILVYNHVIFLSENQRYDLFACIPVRANGILVQTDIKSKNFEAQSVQETFCHYVIDCEPSDGFIEIIKNVIHIHLPPQDSLPDFPSPFKPDELDKYDLYDLLNKNEGGRETLAYSTICHNSDTNKKSFHKVEIKDIKAFEESIDFVDFSMTPESSQTSC